MALFKKAFSAAMNPGLRGVTIDDLAREIRNDTSLNPPSSQRLFSQLGSAYRGADSGTPLSAYAASGVTALVANQAGKYFGMSPVGRTLVTAAGWGLGRQIHDKLNPPVSNNMHGWRLGG